MTILDTGIGLFVLGVVLYTLALFLHTKIDKLRRIGINLEVYYLPAIIGFILIIIGIVSKFIG